jgi:hypothetical protein
MKCELLNEIATLVSIITDLYAAPDPRYTTGFERAPLSRRAVAAALPAHLSSLPAFLPVLSGPTASRRYTGSTLRLGLIGNFRLPLSEIKTYQAQSAGGELPVPAGASFITEIRRAHSGRAVFRSKTAVKSAQPRCAPTLVPG